MLQAVVSESEKHDVERLQLRIERTSAENASLKQELQVEWLYILSVNFCSTQLPSYQRTAYKAVHYAGLAAYS